MCHLASTTFVDHIIFILPPILKIDPLIDNSNKNNKNYAANSKGGSGGGLMRKLKSSFRKSSANSDQNQLQLQQDIDDNDEGTMLPDHQCSPLSSQRPLNPSSPAYSTDSFVTVEVGKLCNIGL